MRILIPWILTSLLLAYLGRRRRGGFWGMLFFSLIFTPLLGLLALILAGPSAREKQRQQVAVARARNGGVSAHPARPGRALDMSPMRVVVHAFLGPWFVLLVGFALIYWFLGGLRTTPSALYYAGYVSLEMATFGLVGATSAVTQAPEGLMRIAMAAERLGVLLLLAAVLVRLLVRRQDRAMLDVTKATEQASTTVAALETTMRAQQAEIQRLRAAAASQPATAPPQS